MLRAVPASGGYLHKVEINIWPLAHNDFFRVGIPRTPHSISILLTF